MSAPTITRESMNAMLRGNFAELACTVTDLIDSGFYQEAIQIIHYTENSFSDEELDKLSEEVRVDTGENLVKDSSGWYIAGDSGSKTLPHKVAMAILEIPIEGT